MSKTKGLPWGLLCLWAGMVLLLTLLRQWPARWLVSSLAAHSGIAMHATGGDIWHGSLELDNLDTPVAAEWNCHIHGLALRCHLGIDAGGVGGGDIQLTLRRSQWTLQQAHLVLPATLLMQHISGLQLVAPVVVEQLSGVGDWEAPDHWQLRGGLHYAGGMTAVDMQGQHYSLQLPAVDLKPQHTAQGLMWTLTEGSELLLGRVTLMPGRMYQVELAQRLLALSPLFQGRALTPDRIDVRVQDHW